MVVELRYESYSPALRTHPLFLSYGNMDPGALRQLCFMAVQEESLLPKQELFSRGKQANAQLFFVNAGLLEYSLPCKCAPTWTEGHQFEGDVDEPLGILPEEDDSDEGFSGIAPPMGRQLSSGRSVSSMSSSTVTKMTSTASKAFVKSDTNRQAAYQIDSQRPIQSVDSVWRGQWACEAALWSETPIELCGPFVAVEKSEVLLVKTPEFFDVISHHEVTRAKVARYAESFSDMIEELTNCRWRVCISNDYSILEDLVYREFESDDQEAGRVTSAIKGLGRGRTSTMLEEEDHNPLSRLTRLFCPA
jgi:hypothetical protein